MERGYERHLLCFIFQRSKRFSIVKYFFCHLVDVLSISSHNIFGCLGRSPFAFEIHRRIKKIEIINEIIGNYLHCTIHQQEQQNKQTKTVFMKRQIGFESQSSKITRL